MTERNDTKKENFIDRFRRKSAERRTKVKKPVEIKGFTRAIPVIMIAAALFLTLCFITAETGAFGKFISDVLMGLFSYMAYTIPAFIVLHAIFFYSDIKEGKLTKKILFSLSALVMLSMIAYIIPNISSELIFDAKAFYVNGKSAHGGGFIGSILAFALSKVIGKVGLIILIALLVALYILYLVSGGGSNLSRFFLKKLSKLANYFADLETKRQESKKIKKEEKLVKQRALDEKKNADFYNDEYFVADNGVSRLEIPELGIFETKSGTAGSPHLRETVIKDEEIDIEDTDEVEVSTGEKKKFFDIEIDEEPTFARTETPKDGFRHDDIVYEEVKPSAEEPVEDTFASHVSEPETPKFSGKDCSADSIFTASFDPFDIAMNEKLAEKPSSLAKEAAASGKGFSEFIPDMTPEQEAQKRRLEEFERNRRAAIARREARETEEAAKSIAAKESTAASFERTHPTAAATEKKYPDRTVSVEYGTPKAAAPAYTEPASKSAPSYTVNKPSAENHAEAERAKEQAMLAGILGGTHAHTEETKKTPAAFSPTKPALEKNGGSTNISSINSDYESAYGGVVRSAAVPSKYRFVGAVGAEPRRAYSSAAPTAEVKESSYSQAPAYTETAAPATPSYTAPAAPAAPAYTVPVTPAAPAYTVPVTPAAPAYTVPVTPAAPAYTAPAASAAPAAPAYTEHETTESVKEDVKIDFEHTADVILPEKSVCATEFNFGSDDDASDAPEAEEINSAADSFESEQTLEVSRTMIDPVITTPERKSGLEFSLYDDEEEAEEEDELPVTEEDAEEIVEKTEIPEDERNPEIYAQRQMFDVFRNDGNTEDNEDSDADTDDVYPRELDENITEAPVAIDDEDAPPFDDYTEDDEYGNEPYEEPAPAPAPKKEEKKKPTVIDYSNYKFPPLELLKKSEEEDWESINREIQYGGEQLINTLDSFNIKATIRGMEHGPRITRYSIVPAKGVRVNQIEKLADDIALALAAESIRIEAPIPGKSAVGVEVPNKIPSLVSLRDLLEADEFRTETSKTCVCIGKSVEGSLVYGDIGSMPHVLIAGATGMGKSVCINSLITSMLYKARPDEVKFIMIDPKKVEFAPYNGIPHLLVPVVTEPKQAAGALMWAVDEMNKRYDIIEKLCVKSIDSYNKKVAENPELGAPMSKIVIFIDELNDLMVQVRDPVENLIMLIAQKARAAGIHLVIGTQRPSVDVITGVIKANIPSRIACKVSSGIDSRTILEQTGAEKLIGKGDMLFAPSGKAPKRVQGAFVSESETESIVDFIKAQFSGEHYDEQALEDMKRAAQKCDKSKSGDGMDDDDDDEDAGIGYFRDQKFLNAVELAIRNGSVATSFLQRKLKIGYGKAAQYIDIMEDQGIVGEKNGAKAREVKMTMEEWREMLNRRLDD